MRTRKKSNITCGCQNGPKTQKEEGEEETGGGGFFWPDNRDHLERERGGGEREGREREGRE